MAKQVHNKVMVINYEKLCRLAGIFYYRALKKLACLTAACGDVGLLTTPLLIIRLYNYGHKLWTEIN